ncbi:MAG: helix-hairpin-helix domain-containing protein [Gammaproteobacteria bacterium]
MATFVIALISFSVAFVAGAILSKAYFAVHGAGDRAAAGEQADEQRRRYRKRVDALQQVIHRHEDAQEQIKAKLRDFRKATRTRARQTAKITAELVESRQTVEELLGRLAARDDEIETLCGRLEPHEEQLATEKRKVESVRNELGLLRLERDELKARCRRLESEHDASPTKGSEQSQSQSDAIAILRADMGEMRENLATRDRQVHELTLQLNDSEARISDLLERLDTWKQRVSPLTSKLRQQRNLIREFRETDPAALAECRRTGDDSAVTTDNLREIRGIGPALERRLHHHGIRSFEQIADLTDRELADIAEQLAIAPNLAQRDRWIEQARELAERRSIAN